MSYLDNHDEDNLFADTRMSFGDHIEDLRKHMLRAIYGFLIGMVLSLFVGKMVLEFIAAPVEEQLQKFYDRRVKQVMEASVDEELRIARRNEEMGIKQEVSVRVSTAQLRGGLGLKDPPETELPKYMDLSLEIPHPLQWALAIRNAQERLNKRFALTTLSVQEAFVVYFKVCIVCGIIISSPWVFYQMWAFVAAGLYPHEKRPVQVYLPFSVGLFWGGVLLCQFMVIPNAIGVLLGFNEWLGLEPDLRLNEWLGFAILLPLITGISFQTPLVMFALFRIGIVSVETLRAKRRYALFFLAVFTAVATPTPDALTMLFLWLPLVALYELGLFLCWLMPGPPPLDLDVPDPEDMVEV